MKNINRTIFRWVKAITIIWNIIWLFSLYGSYSGIQNARNSDIEGLEQIWVNGLERSILFGLLINIVLLTLFFIFRYRKNKANKVDSIQLGESIAVNNDNIDDNPKSTESKRQLNQLAIRPKSLEKIQRFIHLKDEKLSDPEIAQVLILVHEISPLDARLIIEETLGRPFKQDEPLAKQEEAPTQKPKRMKTFRVVLEIVYVAVLGFLFDTIIWNIEVPYQKYRGDDVRTEIADIGWSNGQNLMISIIGLMALILIFEWVRRKKLKGNRPAFEKYFYIPAIFMIFLLGLLVGRFLLISY